MILAIDTATEAFSVALKTDSGIDEIYEIAPRLHAKKMLTSIDLILERNNVQKNQLSAIVFGKGPGGFTGVRIAVSVAQGIAHALQIPAIGVSTLAALALQAHQISGASHILSAIDARMNEVYWAEFKIENGLPELIAPEIVIPPQQISMEQSENESIAAIGSGWDTYQQKLLTSLNLKTKPEIFSGFPKASALIQLSQRYEIGTEFDMKTALPVYLRNKVAKTIKEREGR